MILDNDSDSIVKNSAVTMSLFTEYMKQLNSTLNKFPKNEKFSMCRKIQDDSYEIYYYLVELSRKGIEKRLSYKDGVKRIIEMHRGAMEAITRIKYSFYLAYNLNFYYRCNNAGQKNRCTTSTIDADKNRRGYMLITGFFSVFLVNYYILCIKTLCKNKILNIGNYKELLENAKAAAGRYSQNIQDETLGVGLEKYIANIESILSI